MTENDANHSERDVKPSAWTSTGGGEDLDGDGYKAYIQDEKPLDEIYDVSNQIIVLSYPFEEVCETNAEHSVKTAKKFKADPFQKLKAEKNLSANVPLKD
eukprot:6621273-Heterocapsa_arctica.AAC.1